MKYMHGCRRKKEGRGPRAATLDGFAHVPPQNETALAQAVSQHPVAVAVCCGDYIDNWHQYAGGIFDIPNVGAPLRILCVAMPCLNSWEKEARMRALDAASC